jgi:NDP-hexose-3-ketoreductase
MQNRVNIGVLGYANIAQKAIIPAILESDYFNLNGIATQKEQQLSLLKEKYKCQVFSKYQDLIENKDVQAVYIPLPNSLHFEWVKKALLNKKHVLVEKSLACTLDEVIELNEIAKKQNLALVENFQFRFHDQLQFIKKLINENGIGKIRSIRSSFCFPPFVDKSNIRYKKELGGGALLDAGAYPIKLAKELLGATLKITAANLNNDTFEVDIWGAGTIIETNSNIPLQFVFGFDHHYQCNVEIIGSLGKISTQRIFTAPPGFEVELLVEKNQERKTIKVSPQNHYTNMLNYFYLCSQNEKLRQEEYKDNILQFSLISNFLKLAHE